jgi:RNAPII transcription regulator C-terminal
MKLTTSAKVLSALAEIAKTKPQLILDITFPAFLAELPDSESEDKNETTLRKKKSYKAILAALSQISADRVVFEVLLRRLFNKIDVVMSSTHFLIQGLIFSIYHFRQLSSRNLRDDLPCTSEEIGDE